MHSPPYRQPLESEASKRLPGARKIEPSRPPVNQTLCSRRMCARCRRWARRTSVPREGHFRYQERQALSHQKGRTISASVNLALCSRSRFAKLVEVLQENAQLEIRADSCVASGHLFLVVIQKKVHRIGGIHIVQNDVRIINREPAETQPVSPIRHVVCVPQLSCRCRAGATKGLDN